MNRRQFMVFILIGGLISRLFRKTIAKRNEKKALFWRKKDEA